MYDFVKISLLVLSWVLVFIVGRVFENIMLTSEHRAELRVLEDEILELHKDIERYKYEVSILRDENRTLKEGMLELHKIHAESIKELQNYESDI